MARAGLEPTPGTAVRYSLIKTGMHGSNGLNPKVSYKMYMVCNVVLCQGNYRGGGGGGGEGYSSVYTHFQMTFM